MKKFNLILAAVILNLQSLSNRFFAFRFEVEHRWKMRNDQITKTMNLFCLFYAGNFRNAVLRNEFVNGFGWQIVIVPSSGSIKGLALVIGQSIHCFHFENAFRCLKWKLLFEKYFKDAINFDAIKGQSRFDSHCELSTEIIFKHLKVP